MRVGFDAGPLLRPATGVGHYALSLLEHMLAADQAVEYRLFALTSKRDTSRIPKDPRVTLRHYPIPARFAIRIWSILGGPKAELIGGDWDVFHGPNFWVPPLRARKGIVTIHDLTFLLYPEMCQPPIRRYRWIVPKVLERCELVLTPCETIRSQVAEHLSFPIDRIIATPEGVRGTFKGAVPNERIRAQYGIRGDYLFFVGAQEPRKNLNRLMDAFARLDEEVSLVIGGPQGWGGIDLPGRAESLGIADRVVFTGYLKDDTLGPLVAGARAFVFPSIYEGFGLPPLEAMAAGVPVVAGRGGALTEVLGDAPFWCDPLDVASISDALHKSLTDEHARALAIEHGYVQAALYKWEDTARLTLDAYKKVA